MKTVRLVHRPLFLLHHRPPIIQNIMHMQLENSSHQVLKWLNLTQKLGKTRPHQVLKWLNLTHKFRIKMVGFLLSYRCLYRINPSQFQRLISLTT